MAPRQAIQYSMNITLANHKRQDFFSNLVSCLIIRKQYVNLISVFDAKNCHHLNISSALSKMVPITFDQVNMLRSFAPYFPPAKVL